ncbi:hypothetical protein [Streptomyces sp. NPDC058268]|uniref:hypothetical protein n=1 Tax=Streptomyces sp. NPDC058268 TaxID=3346413 RepID=UPI0036E0C5D7
MMTNDLDGAARLAEHGCAAAATAVNRHRQGHELDAKEILAIEAAVWQLLTDLRTGIRPDTYLMGSSLVDALPSHHPLRAVLAETFKDRALFRDARGTLAVLSIDTRPCSPEW